MAEQTLAQERKSIEGQSVREIFLEGVTLDNLAEQLAEGNKLRLDGMNKELITKLVLTRGRFVTTLSREADDKIATIFYHVLHNGRRVYLHEQCGVIATAKVDASYSVKDKKLRGAGM